MVLICKIAGEGLEDDVVEATYAEKLDYLERAILKQINLFVDALIAFYSLEDQIRGEKDLRRELLFNLVTNFVLQDDLYWLVFNLTAKARE